jgi:hypothetical protein
MKGATMHGSLLLGFGTGLIIVWGFAHLFPTRSVVKGMGRLTEDGRRIAFGTWIAEGVTLIFVGVQLGILVLTFGWDSYTVLWVARISIGLLLVLTVVSFLTSARTAVVPMKICPFVKLGATACFFVGTLHF